MNKLKQVEELQKCIKDPIYFMRTYLEIQHPEKGRIQFDLFGYQEDIVNKILENRFNIVLKTSTYIICSAHHSVEDSGVVSSLYIQIY